MREPRIFLFGEPLSNLDAELRVNMRGELTELHRRLGATMIYVTHDQVEAMTMADKIVVLRAGRVEQVGPPLTLYQRRPGSPPERPSRSGSGRSMSRSSPAADGPPSRRWSNWED